MQCLKCETILLNGTSFCSKCGAKIVAADPFLVVATPTVVGYKIKKVLGVVTGLTPRTRVF